MAEAKRKPVKRKPQDRKKARTRKKNTPLTYELTGIVMIALALIAAFQLGAAGQILTLIFTYLIGNFQLLFPVAIILLSVYAILYRGFPSFKGSRILGSMFILISIFLLSHVLLFDQLERDQLMTNNSVLVQTHTILTDEFNVNAGAGMIGALIYAIFNLLFGSAGSKVAAATLMIIGLIMLSGKSIGETGRMFVSWIAEKLKGLITIVTEWFSEKQQAKHAKRKQTQISRRTASRKPKEPEAIPEETESEPEGFEPLISSFAEKAAPVQNAVTATDQPDDKMDSEEELPDPALEEFTSSPGVEEVENKEYQIPALDLLAVPPHADQSSEYKAIQKNASKLEKTFQSFGVRAKVTQVHLGPAVTKYEVHPDVGVKVSKIVNLNDDLALALAAKDIRIEAPIPGKSAIGIEVPNTEVAMVSLREVLEANKSKRDDAKLLIGLGRDITGEAVAAELNKMPHMLVAGATGSGKSVCINGIIVSILMRAKPHEVKLMMIDPKMVELNVYNGIPHLLAPVVTDARKASQALKKVVSEMERRYDLFSHTGTRNIEGYNEYVRKHNEKNEEKQPQLPFIVVIVDELADLMMVASSDVEDSITRLAQMARAAGIHLIIATQRPSVDVITGVIKANIPSRIAFAVSSQIDSRTILDTGGAEKLLGRGDMLFMPVGANKPVRVQGAFLSDDEVEKVVNAVIEQQKAQYQEEMIPDEVDETKPEESDDELYGEAVDLVVDMQTASVSMLQRRFRIGYTRAARLIDAMEQQGVVGPYEGSKPRTVLKGKVEEE
ncbi:FtsK/SpoIIIE family DNA translocase [Jeotgalibacillus haloalkalitolerans]|uniref:DNA translocase FtsK n=1 Tax=Jeotgalibacillus haloalkalitolerans TaxID=3104292 RepID=A0ABU5KKI0_9BACL|nr:DNA translocase FtsK [Jeotgalibacillus sp. HH7-29]MDZ5711777.1 DNA translocase FtsK [Jeotgalibacillus sp. HH7-29]